MAGRTSGEIIEEEDEDEIEEVDQFSPVPGEVEETIWESPAAGGLGGGAGGGGAGAGEVLPTTAEGWDDSRGIFG